MPTYILRDQAQVVRELEASLEESRGGASTPPGFDTVEAFAAAVDAVKRGDYSGLSKEQLYNLLNANRGLTWERPLVVPACYKNATPYLDCNWKFGVGQGKPYPAALKQWASQIGAAIDKQLKDFIASGKPFAFAQPGATEQVISKQDLLNGIYEGQPDSVKVPEALLVKDKSIDWLMVSKGLPSGYGYTFMGFRFPDGAFTLNSVDPQKSSAKLDPKGLLDVIKSFF